MTLPDFNAWVLRIVQCNCWATPLDTGPYADSASVTHGRASHGMSSILHWILHTVDTAIFLFGIQEQVPDGFGPYRI